MPLFQLYSDHLVGKHYTEFRSLKRRISEICEILFESGSEWGKKWHRLRMCGNLFRELNHFFPAFLTGHNWIRYMRSDLPVSFILK